MSTPNRLTLRFVITGGSGVQEVDLRHPLAAPLRRGLTEGNPTGQFSYLVVFDDDGTARLLGSIVETEGGSQGPRLLFFPGSRCYVDDVVQSRIPPHQHALLSDAQINHVTLDPPFRRGSTHVRFYARDQGDDPRSLRQPVPTRPGHLVPWLSQLIPRPGVLTALPEVLIVRFPQQRPNVVEHFNQVTGGLRTCSMPLPTAAGDPHFLQLDLWAGDWDNWQEDRVSRLPWASKPEVVAHARAVDQTITWVGRDIPFTRCGVRAIVTRPAGTLVSSNADVGGHILRLRQWTDGGGDQPL